MASKTPRSKKTTPLERDIQADILAHCERLAVPSLFPPEYTLRRNNTGAFKNPAGRPVRFGYPGSYDLTGEILGGWRLEVEVKRPGRKLRPDQEKYAQAMKIMGVDHFVAYSLQDFLQKIDQVLKRRGVR